MTTVMTMKRMVATTKMRKGITMSITNIIIFIIVGDADNDAFNNYEMEKAVTTTRALAVVMTTMADKATTTMMSGQSR